MASDSSFRGPAIGRVALTRNQDLVLTVLRAHGEPLGAYAILDRLRDRGMRAPAQVYRALDRLRALGLVHRVETLNAFVACTREDHSPHMTAFVLCDQCGAACELDDDGATATLVQKARAAGYRVDGGRIELHGLCGPCDSDVSTSTKKATCSRRT